MPLFFNPDDIKSIAADQIARAAPHFDDPGVTGAGARLTRDAFEALTRWRIDEINRGTPRSDIISTIVINAAMMLMSELATSGIDEPDLHALIRAIAANLYTSLCTLAEEIKAPQSSYVTVVHGTEMWRA